MSGFDWGWRTSREEGALERGDVFVRIFKVAIVAWVTKGSGAKSYQYLLSLALIVHAGNTKPARKDAHPLNMPPHLNMTVLLLYRISSRLSQALVTARFVVHSRYTYYKFRNSMVHRVLYNLTPASSRKRMHQVKNRITPPLILAEPHISICLTFKMARHHGGRESVCVSCI